MSYLYIFLTVSLTVYGQIVVKWQVLKAGTLPFSTWDKFLYLFHLFLNPWILSSLFAAFLASVSWMAAMTKLPLSYAYPFTTLSFILVLVFSSVFFHETITLFKGIGALLVILGIMIGSQG